MLIRIRDKFFDYWQYIRHYYGLLIELIKILTEVTDFVSSRGSHFCLNIL